MKSAGISDDEFDAKWMALRTRFIARLPERTLDLERHWGDCGGDNARQALSTLFHVAHSLAGSAATFGFDQLARVAREAETSIENAMKSAPPLDDATAARVADSLRQVIGVAASVVAACPPVSRP